MTDNILQEASVSYLKHEVHVFVYAVLIVQVTTLGQPLEVLKTQMAANPHRLHHGRQSGGGGESRLGEPAAKKLECGGGGRGRR